MAKRTYPAMLEPAEGGFGVSFPDLPGCVSFGRDPDDAIRQAEEALSLHLEGMAEDGVPFAEPGHLGDLMIARAGEADAPPVSWAHVTVEAPDAAERVNVYLPKSLLERIDTFAKAAGLNRSSFFNLAARQYMGDRETRPGLDKHQAAALRARLGIRSE